jgi:hypothetical protein
VGAAHLYKDDSSLAMVRCLLTGMSPPVSLDGESSSVVSVQITPNEPATGPTLKHQSRCPFLGILTPLSLTPGILKTARSKVVLLSCGKGKGGAYHTSPS